MGKCPITNSANASYRNFGLVLNCVKFINSLGRTPDGQSFSSSLCFQDVEVQFCVPLLRLTRPSGYGWHLVLPDHFCVFFDGQLQSPKQDLKLSIRGTFI